MNSHLLNPLFNSDAAATEEFSTVAPYPDELKLKMGSLTDSRLVEGLEGFQDDTNMHQLIAQVENIQSAYAKEQLSWLCVLADRVSASYRQEYDSLPALAVACAAFEKRMKAHLLLEETLLFPLLRQLDDPSVCGQLNHKKLAAFVRAMQVDCVELVDLVSPIRSLAASFPTSGDTSSMIGVLLRTVHAVEANSWRRLQAEQSILLPRALVMLGAIKVNGSLTG